MPNPKLPKSPNFEKTYHNAIYLLNHLQTPFSVLEQNRRDGRRTFAVEGMREWLGRIGYLVADVNRLNIIHVAGTKGKTSTCRYVESILNEYRASTGYPTKVGLYTSPHLRYVRDRYQINGVPLSEQLFTKYLFEVWEKVIDPVGPEGRKHPGYFSFLTLIFVHAFLEQGITATIVETGVGGEYDSTNVVDQPIATAVTKIGIDHVRALRREGQNDAQIEDIAWHKAGIFKPGCPAFSVPQQAEAMEILQQRAAEKGTSLRIIDMDAEIRGLSLETHAQQENAWLAVALTKTFLSRRANTESLDLTTILQAARRGIEQTRLPGRFHVLQKEGIWWYLDGAHNVDSLKVAAHWFAEGINKRCPSLPRVLIYNQQSQRDLRGLLTHCFTFLEMEGVEMHYVIFCTNLLSQERSERPDIINHNIDPAAELNLNIQEAYKAQWQSFDGKADITVVPTITEALALAKNIGYRSNGALTLITGSLRLVGGALSILEPEISA